MLQKTRHGIHGILGSESENIYVPPVDEDRVLSIQRVYRATVAVEYALAQLIKLRQTSDSAMLALLYYLLNSNFLFSQDLQWPEKEVPVGRLSRKEVFLQQKHPYKTSILAVRAALSDCVLNALQQNLCHD